MNILHILWNRSGKAALSAMQAVGLSAAVGVAGIAAWQMLGSSEDVNPNTVFSSGSDEQIVYVAGGGYGSGSTYGEGGEVRSGIRAKMSEDMRLMEADYQRSHLSGTELDRQEQRIDAYKMDGASEGLGMGQNAAREKALGRGGDMSAFQAQMSAMQKDLAAKQQAAAKAAASGTGAEGSAEAAAAAALGKQGKGGSGRWGMSSGIARASGNNLNSTPLQAAGAGSGSRRGGTLGGGVGGRAAGPSSGGSALMPQFDGGSEPEIGRARYMDRRDTLLGYVEASKRMAENVTHTTVDAHSIFLANQKVSGGIILNGENVNTGNASSADFSDPDFSGLNKAIGDAASQLEAYTKAREKLRRKVRDFVKSCNTWSKAGGFVLSWIGYGFRVGKRNELRDEIHTFRDTWGDVEPNKSTNGAFDEVARDVVDTAFNWIGIPNGPRRYTKDQGRAYWDDKDAFWSKEAPGSKAENKQEPEVRSPFASSSARDALQVGSIGSRY